MEEVKKIKAAPKMMAGSESEASYFAFARKGNVVLGIKPYGMVKGENYGVSGTTYFTARLRSAPAGNLFDDEKTAKIVKLVQNPPNLWDAWPGVEWEKKDDKRASTTIGVFIKGQFSRDMAVLQQLLDEVSEKKMATKMAKYLIELAGAENALMSVRDLAECVDKPFDDITQRVVARIKEANYASEEMSSSIGVFGMQSAILKKAHDKFAKAKIVKHEPQDDEAEAEEPDELVEDAQDD